MRKLLVAMLIAAASAVLAVQALAATRSVKVGDDYFVRKGSVPTVTVKKGTKVTWRWAGKDMHNVAVTKGPVKFRSSYKTLGHLQQDDARPAPTRSSARSTSRT